MEVKTNGEWLRSLNDNELADYLYAVFLAGRWNRALGNSLDTGTDLIKWLGQPRDEDNNVLNILKY